MMAIPPDTPVTIPVDPTVATPVDAELHVPPVPVVDRVIKAPAHTVIVPDIVPALATGFTLIVVAVAQPVGNT